MTERPLKEVKTLIQLEAAIVRTRSLHIFAIEHNEEYEEIKGLAADLSLNEVNEELCPLCNYDDRLTANCLSCPWSLITGDSCCFSGYINSAKSIERLDDWLALCQEERELREAENDK